LIWDGAGFTTTVQSNGPADFLIGRQDKVAGQLYPCDTTIVTVKQ
jgi:hypothetical protein